MVNTQVQLISRPKGMAEESNFRFADINIDENLLLGEILVGIKFISLDPAMRGWMNEGTTYIKGVELGSVMRAFAIGEVLQSNNENYKIGDWVQGLMGAQTYFKGSAEGLQKIENKNFEMSWYLGILGMPGLTAYFGLLDKCKPKTGDTILVSAAAGMVGSLVGQIAKIKGCTTIGIAGGKEKCDYIKQHFAFDSAIDYKNENVKQQIKNLAPKGVDIYFDNVGGQILDDALLNLAVGARVVVCGAISQYNDSNFLGLKNYMKIVSARATLSGIIVFDYFNRANEAIADLGQWLTEGKINYKEHRLQGIQNFVPALQTLFKGENIGKVILAVG